MGSIGSRRELKALLTVQSHRDKHPIDFCRFLCYRLNLELGYERDTRVYLQFTQIGVSEVFGGVAIV